MRNESAAPAAAAVTLLVISGFLLTACGDKYTMPPPTPTVARFQFTHHVGGTHYCVLVNEGRCIQAFGSSVQIIDPTSLVVVNDVPLGEFGHCGPAVDLAINGERLYAVIEDDAVVELSLPAGLPPKVLRSISSEDLGLMPRRLSVVDGDVYVSGQGGVFNVTTGKSAFTSDEECGRVARAGDGVVVCVGRRVKRLKDGSYVGAATDLINLPADVADKTPATLAFALRGEDNALAGLMTPDVREIPSGKATVAMPESVQRVRVLDGQVFVVGSQRIDWYDIKSDALEPSGSVSILGALDVGRLDQRTLVIVGTAGRAIYQIDEHDANKGQWIAAQREASRLTLATGDGLNVLAGSREGAWMYLVNARAELTKQSLESAPAPQRVAATLGARAEISADGSMLKITPSAAPPSAAPPSPQKPAPDKNGHTPPPTHNSETKPPPGPPPGPAEPWEYREDKGAKIRTVIAVNGDFWLGTDRGITILWADAGASKIDPKVIAKSKKDPNAPLPVANPIRQRLRLPGPVRYLFPLTAGKGASYVSEFGGFGAARFADEEVP